jgi:Domain of unknown function (DUF4261)
VRWLRKATAAVSTALSVLLGSPGIASEQVSPNKSPVLAMVALLDEKIPSSQDVATYLNSNWPKAGPFESSEDGGGLIAVNGPNGFLMSAILINLPIPAEELQFPCETATGWDDACEQMNRMSAHLIVTAMGADGGRKSQTFYLSAMLQAVTAQSNSPGVYVGGASSVWSREQLETATLQSTLERPPWLLWLGIKGQKESNGTLSILTIGMPEFGLMNIEVQKSTSDSGSTIEIVAAFADYLLSEGATVRNGETVGFSEDQKIRVSYAPSMLDHSQTVYFLHY